MCLLNCSSGHGTADDLMEHFPEKVLESGLPVTGIIQVSMDGPNVNWKIFGELKKKIDNDFRTSLVNIWSCGFHVVHNSFKRGMDVTEWKVSSKMHQHEGMIMKTLPAPRWCLWNLSTADGSKNIPVCQRALDIWDNIMKYVAAAEKGKVSKPNNKSYEVITECVQDKCFVAKLHFFKCFATQLQPFLSKYQTNRPMVPFLCDDLCQVIKALMRRFVKKDVLNAASDEKLTKLDVTDSKNHVDY